MICDLSVITGVQQIALVGVFVTVTLIGVGYMLGKFFGNPNLILWSKTESTQIIASILVIIILLEVISLFCMMTVYDFMKLIGMEGHAIDLAKNGVFSSGASIYDAASSYLNWSATYSHNILSLVRYTMGVIEIRSSFSRWQCEFFCLLGGGGTSYSPFAGDYTVLGALSILLNSATISLLSVLFQMYTLKYIQTGLFLLLLPFGVVLRSVPFMRGLGGALIAFVIVMYIFYPLLLVVDGIIWPGIAMGALPQVDSLPKLPIMCDSGNKDVFKAEEDLQLSGVGTWFVAFTKLQGIDKCGYLSNLAELFVLNAMSFIGSIFLMMVNFIIIIAMTREVSRAIGEEMDISRLVQMV
jgi:hypothetical protein